MEALTGFSHIYSPDDLNSTLLSQGGILENGSHCGNDGQSIHSKERGRSEKLPIAGLQLMGQPGVTSSQQLPPSEAVTTSGLV